MPDDLDRSLDRSVDRSLEKELRLHLQQQIDAYIAAGMTPNEAARRARLDFGGVEQIAEECRESRATFWLHTTWQDIRYGLRVLRKSPAFTAVAVLSLALGIGANTAIFSAIDALLLRQLPVRDPGRLVLLTKQFPEFTNVTFLFSELAGFAELHNVFLDVCAIVPVDRSGEDGSQVRTAVVTANYFSVLGVEPRMGRVFTKEEDSGEGAHPVAVISHGYWQRKTGSAPDALGSAIAINGVKYTVIGIMPREFTGDWVGRPLDMWIPVAMLYNLMPELPHGPRGSRMSFRVIARLAPGVSPAAAQTAARVRLHQETGPDASPEAKLVLQPFDRGFSPQRATFTQPLAILMSMVGALLLIACSNVANLLMARSGARRQEIAVRLAIGAGRARIVRQLLVESLLLAFAGGIAGAVFAAWGAGFLGTLARNGPIGGMSGLSSIDLNLRSDARVFLFNASLCLFTGVLFGLLPALRGSNVPLAGALVKRGADSGSLGGRFGLRNLIVASQVAISLVLLAATGLFVRSLHNLRGEDLGIARERLLLVWTQPGQTGRNPAGLAALYETVQQKVAAIPGVVSAAPSVYGMLSFSTGGDGPPVIADGYTLRPNENPRAQFHIVGPGYFDTTGMRLIEGRDFNAADTSQSTFVAVINESMARYFFGTSSALGRHVRANFGANPMLEVVGVVSDSKINSPRDRGRMTFYYPVRQQVGLRLVRMCLIVRTAGPPVAMAQSIRDELRRVDARLPVLKIDTIDEQLEDILFQERLVANLAVFFAAVAVTLACVGLYGVLSYAVSRRTNEIGIRMALGARRADVLGMVLRESLTLAAIGVALGIPASLAAARFIRNQLWGVGASDPLTFAGATLLMVLVASIAGIIPARRASKVDPMEALRYE